MNGISGDVSFGFKGGCLDFAWGQIDVRNGGERRRGGGGGLLMHSKVALSGPASIIYPPYPPLNL